VGPTTCRDIRRIVPVPVDFLVAEAMAGRPGRRGAHVPGQPENSARQVRGLEGVLVDNDVIRIGALNDDPRSFELRVAGPAALIVAKMHKIAERVGTKRSHDKDALESTGCCVLSNRETWRCVSRVRAAAVSTEPTDAVVAEFKSLFGSPRAAGTDMIVRATSGLELEDDVRRATAALAEDLGRIVGPST
jgi:hypothetical protein